MIIGDYSRAVRLDETLECIQRGQLRVTSVAGAEARLARWQNNMKIPRAQLLHSWASVFGTTPDLIVQCLAVDRLHCLQTKPGWLKRLEYILSRYETDEAAPQEDVPYENCKLCIVAWPWLRTAREALLTRFNNRWGANASQLTWLTEAHQLLYRQLLLDVLNLVERTMALEVNVARLRGLLKGDSPKQRFEHFCRISAEPTYGKTFWAEYASLARRLTESCELWVSNSDRFLARLDRDRKALLQSGLLQTNDSGLQCIDFVGDSHNLGQRVAILTFDTSQKLVYKPRSVCGERTLQEIAEWLASKDGTCSLRVPRMLAKEDFSGEYGWTEFVTPSKTYAESELRSYYYKSGSLLAIADIFGYTDLICDNVIASVNGPVVVDAECAAGPVPLLEHHALQADSLLAPGLLPGFRFDDGVDLSVLAGRGGNSTQLTMNFLHAKGSDEMWASRRIISFKAEQNTPSIPPIGELEVQYIRYAHEVLAGYRDACRIFRARSDEVTHKLATMMRSRFRTIPRSSTGYYLLGSEILHPNLQRDALDGEAVIAHLLVNDVWRGRLFCEERKALWRGDIPIFKTAPNSTSLWTLSGQEVRGCFQKSGSWRMHQELSTLPETSQRKEALIQLCLNVPVTRRVDLSNVSPTGTLGRKCLCVAESIADFLLAEADERSGQLRWFHRNENTASRSLSAQVTVEILQDDLYSGTAGVLLLFTYLAKVTGKNHYRAFAERLFQELAQRLKLVLERPPDVLPSRKQTWGGFEGPISSLYVLLHAADFGERETLAELSKAGVGRTLEHILRDKRLDLISGTAGILRILAAIEASIPRVDVRSAILAAGDHLLASAEMQKLGIAWPTLDRPPQTGLGHGAAGISLGLITAWRSTREKRFQTAAYQALIWEDSLYDLDARNWKDLRPSDIRSSEGFATGWCAGAPGILLSRAALYEDVEFRGFLDSKRESTLTVRNSIISAFSDGLCHGAVGNIECLWSCLLACDRAQIRDAEAMLEILLERIATDGFRFVSSTYPLGFMVGLSGIGYSLLRMSQGNNLPNALLLEPPR